MAALLDDNWVQSNSEIDPLKLHAIGVIALGWNECEKWLFHLYSDLAGHDTEDAWRLTRKWSGQKLCKEIRAKLPSLELQKDAETLVLNALHCYESCCENRNSVVHLWTIGRGYHAKFGRVPRRSPSPDPIPFECSLCDLRQVADDIHSLGHRLWLLAAIYDDGRLKSEMSTPPPLSLPKQLLVL